MALSLVDIQLVFRIIEVKPHPVAGLSMTARWQILRFLQRLRQEQPKAAGSLYWGRWRWARVSH